MGFELESETLSCFSALFGFMTQTADPPQCCSHARYTCFSGAWGIRAAAAIRVFAFAERIHRLYELKHT